MPKPEPLDQPPPPSPVDPPGLVVGGGGGAAGVPEPPQEVVVVVGGMYCASAEEERAKENNAQRIETRKIRTSKARGVSFSPAGDIGFPLMFLSCISKQTPHPPYFISITYFQVFRHLFKILCVFQGRLKSSLSVCEI